MSLFCLFFTVKNEENKVNKFEISGKLINIHSGMKGAPDDVRYEK